MLRPFRHPLLGAIHLLLTLNVVRGIEPSAGSAQLEEQYAAQLAELAAWCDHRQLAPQADLMRHWLPKRDPLKQYVFVIPDSAAPPAALADSSDAKEWWKRFMELRTAQAAKLYAQAEAAAKEKRSVEAIQLARQALRENPDLETARQVLGYAKFEGRWVWPKEAQWLQAGKVWSDEFGWLSSEQLEKYKRGQRLFRGRWIDAAEDARLRSNINHAWQIETEHYQVRTTHSLAAGVQLARKLESLYDVWRATFVDYYAAPETVAKWFADGTGPNPNLARKSFSVVLFRDKQEYVDAVRPLQPQVAMSIGTYLDRLRIAYFFASEDQTPTTLDHEATHQLFREERPGAIEPGRKNNFWIVEAIACYMESLTEHRPLAGRDDGMYYTLGGANEGRAPAARARLQRPEYLFYMPLRELAPLGMDALQRDPHLPQIYTQCSGVAWFLMAAERGQYRPALMDLLIAVYTGRASETSLEKLTGMKYEELDRQYREFMK
ncbi:MAG: hypothetical protein IT427_02400 [Pirellulales bacterium]|nr:hypothetical protein [Pirellulales bacterium]